MKKQIYYFEGELSKKKQARMFFLYCYKVCIGLNLQVSVKMEYFDFLNANGGKRVLRVGWGKIENSETTRVYVDNYKKTRNLTPILILRLNYN